MIELDEKTGSLNVLGNIFDSFSNELSIPNYCYIKMASEADVSIQIKNNELENISSSALRIIDEKLSKILLTTVKLFEYLETQGLAYFIGNVNCERLGQVWIGEQYSTCDFLESESKRLIYQYARKNIYITEELGSLLKNDFQSNEQIRHKEVLETTKKELFFTRSAFLLSFIGLLSSILVPFFSTTKVEVVKEIAVSNMSSSINTVAEKIDTDVKNIDKIEEESRDLKKGEPGKG
jgi:hypothetical protein